MQARIHRIDRQQGPTAHPVTNHNGKEHIHITKPLTVLTQQCKSTSCRERKAAHPCLTLWDPVVYTAHGILQARVLEWVAFPFSNGSSRPRSWTRVSCIAGGFFSNWDKKINYTSIKFLKINQVFSKNQSHPCDEPARTWSWTRYNKTNKNSLALIPVRLWDKLPTSFWNVLSKRHFTMR